MLLPLGGISLTPAAAWAPPCDGRGNRAPPRASLRREPGGWDVIIYVLEASGGHGVPCPYRWLQKPPDP
jgi:hypothetical protein